MEIIPAIDLKNGKCVRLLQGRDDSTTEYAIHPLEVAQEFTRAGVSRLHIVNLDGAFGRSSGNLEIVREITSRATARVQFGGGLRTLDDVHRAFELGIDKAVLGTSVMENPVFVDTCLKTWGAGRLIVALDAMQGKLAARGWQSILPLEVLEFALELKQRGVTEILYTDIQRDGMMVGADTATVCQLASTGLDVIASGGISSHDDVSALCRLGFLNLTGVIIGKALYEKRIELSKLLEEVSHRS